MHALPSFLPISSSPWFKSSKVRRHLFAAYADQNAELSMLWQPYQYRSLVTEAQRLLSSTPCRDPLGTCMETYLTGCYITDGNSFRQAFAPDLDQDLVPAYVYLPSTRNIVIERSWRPFLEKLGRNIQHHWAHGRMAAGFIDGNHVHRYVYSHFGTMTETKQTLVLFTKCFS